MSILKLEHLRKFYGTHEVLKDINLEVAKSEVVVILGPSGCGKSTLLRCINGLESIASGAIYIDGTKIDKDFKEWIKIRQKVGMVFQSYELFEHLSVEENILLAPMKAQARPKDELKTTDRYLGTVTDGEDGYLRINGVNISVDSLMKANTERYSKVYPATMAASHKKMMNVQSGAPARKAKYHGEPVEHPVVFIPVFPGTNCDYDTAKAFRKAGAEVRFGVFCNLTAEDVRRSIREMSRNISECHILALAGGFSAGDEPDGSGKFIANVLNNSEVSAEIEKLIARGGLILGICNGFQALVKSGLLPYGKTGMLTKDSPTLFRNDINRHISQMVTTRVSTTRSPWLAGMNEGDLHTIAVSHGEGKFVVNEALARELFENGQVAFQYVNPFTEDVTMESPYNPNGSFYAIEGIISPDGQILGKICLGNPAFYQRRIEVGLEQRKRLQVVILQLLNASLLLPVLIQCLLQPDKNLRQLLRVDGL